MWVAGFDMHTIQELEPKLVSEVTLSGRRRVVMRKRLEKKFRLIFPPNHDINLLRLTLRDLSGCDYS